MAEDIIQQFTSGEYKEGFVTDVEQEFIPKGLNEDIVRMISARKEEPQWLLEFRLDALRKWQGMPQPDWAHLDMPEMLDLLSRAGYTLSPNSKFDLIISYFVENRKYNIIDINIALFDYGQPLLSS